MDAPYMCSADPAKEPPISLPLGIEFVGGNREDGGKIPLSRAQDMWSYAINDDMVELPVKPFFVDRSTSLRMPLAIPTSRLHFCQDRSGM